MKNSVSKVVPAVSVVIPAYNAERYLEAAVRSVLAQTWFDFEILIVDDCSTDGTVALMSALAAEDSRIICFHNSQNLGVAETRNIAIAKAQGEWIAFLDSDDLWRADKLEKQLALAASNSDAVLIYTGSAFMDQNGALYDYVMPAELRVTYQMLLRQNKLSCSSVMVKRSIMQRYPMRDSRTHEDYGAWLRILREVPAAYGVNEPLLIYRIVPGSKSSGRLRSANMYYLTCRDIGYGWFISGLLTARYAFFSISKRWRVYNSGKKISR